jgi:DNA (cytosine-5)-methyltransferase 1
MKKGSKKRDTAIDLFSGCGGLSVGLRGAGYEVVAAVENESLACETYRMNHKQTLLLEGDITKVRPEYLRKRLGLKRGELSLLAGCPPCQGFSTLRTLNGGKRVKEPMTDLIFQFLKFVRAFRPKAIMMENVPGLADDPRIETFRKKIAGLGYRSEVRVMDAADYGTPQRRRRMVLIAVKGKAPKFASEARYKKSVRWAFSKVPARKGSADPLHNYKVKHAEHVIELIKKIPKDGGGRADLSDDEQLPCHQKCDGFKDIYGRMSWSRPSPTITGGCINPSKGRFVHPSENRAITLREAAVLQGFPLDYRFDLSRGRYPVAQLIGNAFPPSFAARHARMIKTTLARA